MKDFGVILVRKSEVLRRVNKRLQSECENFGVVNYLDSLLRAGLIISMYALFTFVGLHYTIVVLMA